MRTIVDIPDEQISVLKAMGERDHLSRAELVRRALAEYIRKRQVGLGEGGCFGLWKDRDEDGLVVQHKLREEWGH